MKKFLLTRLIFVGTASVVVSAGAFRVISAYRSGSGFVPFANEREFNGNQVLFPGEDSVQSQNGDNQNDDASFMEKDNDAEDSADFSGDNSSSYLYENNKTVGSDDGGVTMFADNGNMSDGQTYGDGNGISGGVIEFTDDRSGADMIIGSGASSDGSGRGSSSEAAADNNAAGSGYTSAGSGSSGSGAGGSGGAGGGGAAGGGAGGGSAADPGNNGGATTPDTPNNGGNNGNNGGSTPASTAKDPVADKKEDDLPYNGTAFRPGIENSPYMAVVIGKPSMYSSNMLYCGQTVDQHIIFASLDACVQTFDPSTFNEQYYYWTDADYGKYFRVDAISFDEGESWISDFPVTIPKELGAGKMQIKVSYRFNDNSEWIEEIVGKSDDEYNKYDPEPYRVMILSRQISEENTTISSSDILNPNQYGDASHDGIFNLLGSNGIDPLYKHSSHMYDQSVNSIFDERIKDLFPGWTEDGVQVPWIYEPTNGRHILEPMDFVPIDDAYDIRLRLFWMSKYTRYDFISNDELIRRSDLGIDTSEYNDLSYLQTLRDYTAPTKGLLARLQTWLGFENGDTILEVPKYVQSIDIEDGADVDTDYLDIPDTVMNINTQSAGLKVHKGFRVADDNPYFASENGMLYTKDKTEIIAVPDEMTELKVGEGVLKVNIPENNSVKQVDIEMGSGMEYPEFTGKLLTNCRFVMDINDFENFLYDNLTGLFAEGTGNCLVADDDPDVTYTLYDAALIDSNMSVYRVLDIGATSVRFPEGLKTVTTFSFAMTSTITKIILPSSGEPVDFEKNSLFLSSINTIICSSKEQYDSIRECIADTGVDDPDNVKIILSNASKDGYAYTVDTAEDGSSYVTLISAPADVRSFDGYVYDDDGNEIKVNAVGDNAFNGCSELIWAVLPEETESIGYRAFAGCDALQGVFIGTKDSIYIGNNAFDNCSELRFVASNAMYAEMGDGYDPAVTDRYSSSVAKNDYFFALPGSEGYGSNCNSLENMPNLTGIKEYELIKLDNSSSLSDSRVLYLKFNDSEEPDNSDKDEYIVMRSSTVMPEETVLADRIRAFYPYALADTVSQSGDSYSLDWSSLDMLQVINYKAFIDAAIGGDVTINANKTNGYLSIGSSAFRGTKISSIDFETDIVDFSDDVFVNCSELESVVFEEFDNGVSIYAGTFSGSDKLKSIRFKYNLPGLTINGSTPFRFNYDHDIETPDNLEIILPYNKDEDPELFEDYVNVAAESWRFAFLGYAGYGGSPYLELRGDVDYELRDPDTWDSADDLTINAEVEKRVLEGENAVRTLLGADPVDEPTNLYHYKTDYWGDYVYLTGAPKHDQYVMLYGNWIGLPSGWSLDYICKDAFAVSEDLISIDIPKSIIGIEEGAFNVKALHNDKLTVYLSAETVPQLMLNTEGVPYEFGLDDDKLNFEVYGDEAKQAYLEKWAFPLAGYDNLETMRYAVGKELGYIKQISVPDIPWPDWGDYDDYGDLFSADNALSVEAGKGSDEVFYSGEVSKLAEGAGEAAAMSSETASQSDNAADMDALVVSPAEGVSERAAAEADNSGIAFYEGSLITEDKDSSESVSGSESTDGIDDKESDKDAGENTGSDNGSENGGNDSEINGGSESGDSSFGSGSEESGETGTGSDDGKDEESGNTGSDSGKDTDESGSESGGSSETGETETDEDDDADVKGEDGLTVKERAEVDKVIAERILPCENRLRVMFGMEEVDHVTAFEPTVYEPKTKDTGKEETEIEEPGTGKDTDAGKESGETGTETGSGSESGTEESGSGSASGSETGSDAGSSTGTESGAETGSSTGAESGAETGSGSGSETGSGSGSESGSEIGGGTASGAESGSETGGSTGSESDVDAGDKSDKDNEKSGTVTDGAESSDKSESSSEASGKTESGSSADKSDSVGSSDSNASSTESRDTGSDKSDSTESGDSNASDSDSESRSTHKTASFSLAAAFTDKIKEVYEMLMTA